MDSLLISGNTFDLYQASPTWSPSGAATLTYVDKLNLSGNTLTTGGAGLQMFHYFELTNAVVLGNDFRAATTNSVRDIGYSGDLLSAVMVKNQLSSGVNSSPAHLKGLMDDGPHYFLLCNEYVDGAGQPNTLLLDPANLPVHVVP